MQITTSWKEEGIEEGIKRGIEIGRRQAQEEAMQITTSWKEEGAQREALKLVERRLNRLFGELEAKVRERLAALSTPQLEALDEAAFDFKEHDDLTAWLDKQPQ